MAIFNSYVSSPEGIPQRLPKLWPHWSWTSFLGEDSAELAHLPAALSTRPSSFRGRFGDAG